MTLRSKLAKLLLTLAYKNKSLHQVNMLHNKAEIKIKAQ